ncbi:MAG TPA: hypothetical protein VG734_25725 [Lacunisphaera sp.]|nr:hypothetical protein [Lacunisphaera sp.]
MIRPTRECRYGQRTTVDCATLLATALPDAAAAELSLVVTCACGARTGLPCKLLARSYPKLTIGAVVPRLLCRRCRARPMSVVATDRADGLGQGGPTATVAVELLVVE